MRKAISLILAGLAAAAIGGAAVAANPSLHVMNVSLPDGSTARVEYVGKVPPKVTIVPDFAPSFGIFDRSMFDMDRQIEAMMRQVGAMARAPMGDVGAPVMNVAAYGNAPGVSRSVTIVSTSDGDKSCTRTTEATSQGDGRPPKVVSNVSGDCGRAASSAPALSKPTT